MDEVNNKYFVIIYYDLLIREKLSWFWVNKILLWNTVIKIQSLNKINVSQKLTDRFIPMIYPKNYKELQYCIEEEDIVIIIKFSHSSNWENMNGILNWQWLQQWVKHFTINIHTIIMICLPRMQHQTCDLSSFLLSEDEKDPPYPKFAQMACAHSIKQMRTFWRPLQYICHKILKVTLVSSS